jgi:DNA-binding transcriptional ArsR family regulator
MAVLYQNLYSLTGIFFYSNISLMNTHMFSVLAEPHRLGIVELLHRSPHTVNEIVEELRLNQPQVSKHLKVLSEAGIVGVHPVKNKRVYALKPERFRELDVWLKKYRSLWEERLDRLEVFLQKEEK